MLTHQKLDNILIILFYLVPLLLLPRLYKYFKNSIDPDRYIFNKKTGLLTINENKTIILNRINEIKIEYPNKLDIEECILVVGVEGAENIQIDRTDASFNREVIRVAEQIGRYLNIKVIDEHPYNDK